VPGDVRTRVSRWVGVTAEFLVTFAGTIGNCPGTTVGSSTAQLKDGSHHLLDSGRTADVKETR